MADLKLSQVRATDPATAAAGASLWSTRGDISGLRMEWISSTSIRVTSGDAHIQSLGFIFPVNAAITKAGLALAANTTHHVYLFINAGAADIEIVTTAPAAPYNGTARSKTGDTSRRYLGSIRTDGSGNVYNFLHHGDSIRYRINPGATPFRILSSGSATTETTVSAAAVVPLTSRVVTVRLINIDATAVLRTDTSDSSNAGAASIVALSAGAQAFLDHPLDSSQALTYWFDTAPAAGNAFIDVYGYTFER